MNGTELRDICVAAAEEGARVLRDLYDRPREVHFKGRIDLVTDADKASEEAVLRVLRDRAPGASILAEESGASGEGEISFIVDPLDGTTNYAHGLPLFACTVAAEENGVPVAGCTVDPLRDESFFAARGKGAVLRRGFSENRCASRPRARWWTRWSAPAFPTATATSFPQMLAAFGKFTELSRGTRRLGSAALDLAYVAAGRLDGFWETGLRPWDVAAGHLLVEEAGGAVTRFDGSQHRLAGGEIVAAPPGLHEKMLRILTSAAAR